MVGTIVSKDILIKVEQYVAPPAEKIKLLEKKPLKSRPFPLYIKLIQVFFKKNAPKRCVFAKFLGAKQKFRSTCQDPTLHPNPLRPCPPPRFAACESEGSSASKGTTQMPSSTFSASMPRCRASSFWTNHSCCPTQSAFFVGGSGRVGVFSRKSFCLKDLF